MTTSNKKNNINKKPQDFLNEKIKRFKPYTPSGNIENYQIRLDANESFINLPEFIIKDIQNEIKSLDFNRYPDFLASEVIKRYSPIIGVDEKYIVAGNGSDELISVIVNAFLSKGDKILTFAPDFSMYAFYSEIIEAQIITVEKKSSEDFAIDFDEADRIIKEQNIKAVIFSNPCNPTGKLTDKAVLKKFIENTDALVIIDEVYMTFCGDSKAQSFIRDCEEYPNLIVLKSLSKAVGLASIRVGFAISNEVFINALRAVKSPFNVNTISQKIAQTVLKYPDYINEQAAKIKENKAELESAVQKLIAGNDKYLLHMTQTNFILLEIKEEKKDEDLFEYLMRNKILVRNLKGGFLRISTGSKEENRVLLKCIKNYLQ